MKKSIHELLTNPQCTDNERSYLYFLDMRGVEYPCHQCNGLGIKAYGSTATWHGGIGGQAITNGICDHCWGSGDEYKHGINLKKLYNKLREDDVKLDKETD